MKRYCCIHGHFYQPPRENPWLERIEIQDSAFPYHDWNERIADECYAPNAAARILDASGKMASIVNNYAHMSFNFGPTLLAWLERHDAPLHQQIIDADRISREVFDGHGSAMAQGYNHIIFPLANSRDKRTQVRWGIRDFVARFERAPEGLWLPETAVDLETLDILAEEGIRFTVLSPYQAKRYRSLNAKDEWHDAVGGRIDPTRAYVQKLSSGRSIALFFYDGPISRGIAFERLLSDGKLFAQRLANAFVNERSHTQIVHIATDGETYGHHHRFGEMALAYAMRSLRDNHGVTLTNYSQFLRLHPPTVEVDILENTSWSCSHGVERWRSNCGCKTGGLPGWSQAWRGPLRDSLNLVRDAMIPLFEQEMMPFVEKPWDMRDAYIDVILDRRRDNIESFLHTWCKRALQPVEKTRVLKLLELQRNAMLMFTSCGWFFDEISGIETVQCLQYAGRVLQLAQDLFDNIKPLEDEFLKILATANSNLPNTTGDLIYREAAAPAAIDLLEVAAHYAVNSVFEVMPDTTNLYSYEIRKDEIFTRQAGRARLTIGKAHVVCQTTLNEASVSFGALYTMGHNINAGVRFFLSDSAFAELTKEAGDAFEKVDYSTVFKVFEKHFSDSNFSLKSLFRDEQLRITQMLTQTTNDEIESLFHKMYLDNYNLMRFFHDLKTPMPRTFLDITNFVLSSQLRRALEEARPDARKLRRIVAEGNLWGFQYNATEFSRLFQLRAEALIQEIEHQPLDSKLIRNMLDFLNVCREMPFPINLWKVQNSFYHMARAAFPRVARSPHVASDSGKAWLESFERLAETLGIVLTSFNSPLPDAPQSP